MSAGYRTQGLPKRLVQFFADNPEEELTLEMVIVKFDARPEAAESAVRRLVGTGALEAVRVIRLPARGRPKADSGVDSLHAYDLGE